MFLYSDNFVTYKKNTKYAVELDFHSHRKKAWQAASLKDGCEKKCTQYFTPHRTGPNRTELKPNQNPTNNANAQALSARCFAVFPFSLTIYY